MKRPGIETILNDDFMTQGYLPSRLPTSCLTMAPRFDTKMQQVNRGRGPLQEINREPSSVSSQGSLKKTTSSASDQGYQDQCNGLLQELHKQLASVIATNPASKKLCNEDEVEDPKASPMVWVSKWVDYSDKYGFGYALCDESIGVVFNDLTKLLLLSDNTNIHYIDFEGGEHYYTLKEYPAMLEKKVKLLNYFMNYMKEHLLKAGAGMQMREGDELSRIPFLRTWFRTSRAVVMFLTNGTLQVKIISRQKFVKKIHDFYIIFSDQLLQRSHQSDSLSFDGCGDLHRRRTQSAHLPLGLDRKIRLQRRIDHSFDLLL